MNLIQLENLVKTNDLKKELFNQEEYDGLIKSGNNRLKDALRTELTIESRFDLAYNATHAFALAALRKHGFRSNNRYLVFQVLPHTLGLEANIWRIFDKCHRLRNLAEYEGFLEINNQLFEELLSAAQTLQKQLNNPQHRV